MKKNHSVGDFINTNEGTILKVTHINPAGLYSCDEWDITKYEDFRFIGERMLTLREIRALEAKT